MRNLIIVYVSTFLTSSRLVDVYTLNSLLSLRSYRLLGPAGSRNLFFLGRPVLEIIFLTKVSPFVITEVR